MCNRNSIFALATSLIILALPGISTAELFDRGGGLIYDDELNVTWLQDTNYAQTSGYDADGQMTLAEAQTWVDNLSYYDSVRGVTYDDWRLPNATDVGNDGATYSNYYEGVDYGYNITTPSELSYMFYQNLGNVAAFTTAGFSTGCSSNVPNYCLTNTGLFTNFLPDRYWTNQPYGQDANRRFIFYFDLGAQQYTDNGNVEYAWAVRDGDVATPTTQSVTINTGSFTGLWDMDLDGDFVSGSRTLDLKPGTHRFRAGTTAQILFSVDASGIVTLASAYDGVSATGGAGVLNLLSVPVSFDPGDYEGLWAISRVRDAAPGPDTVYLVPSEQTDFNGSVGGSYILSFGIASSGMFVYVRDSSGLSFVDGGDALAGAVYDDQGVVRFRNTLITVTDRNDSNSVWVINSVTPPFNTVDTPLGDLSLTVVPEAKYLFQTPSGSSSFDVSDIPCAVSPEEQITGGLIFDITCGLPDTDGDGVLNEIDNCPDAENSDQLDTDADGVGDVCDEDLDGDGINNAVDNCGMIPNPDQIDTDTDGIGDACDSDDDGDSVLDYADNCPLVSNSDQSDVDGDSFGDVCDNDLDGDAVDNQLDNCPIVPNALQEDLDSDGLGDDCDADDDNDGVCDIGVSSGGCIAGPDNCPVTPNTDQLDFDGDNIGDACDADFDGDGVDNGQDNCSMSPNPDQNDTDGDGLGDACDEDDDADTIADGNDNCPFIVNPNQIDLDGDGVGDACDGDQDGDGVANTTDNCPTIPNSGQYDLDADGVGDACDSDIDGDGVDNSTDQCSATTPGETVDGDNGCSIAQLCPCDGPRGTNVFWKNHGKYVSCTAHASKIFRTKGLISNSERQSIMSAAGQSSCGE